jgi:hypothetical protein
MHHCSFGQNLSCGYGGMAGPRREAARRSRHETLVPRDRRGG